MQLFSNDSFPQRKIATFPSPLTRKPSRVTVTIPWSLRQQLDARSDQEGRSLSNLIAYLLEKVLSE